MVVDRPERSECADYYFLYIDQVPPGNVLRLLSERITAEFLRVIPSERLDFSYAPGKWTVKEVIGHVIDVERAFSHRAFCFARRDPAALPGFEQDDYVKNSRYSDRSLSELLEEYDAVRRGTLALFEGFNEQEWGRRGIASGVEFTVRTMPFILAGHEIHHRRVLEERYLA